MGKRTNIDFSKHELTSYEFENGNIHKLAIPDTRMNSITFINSCGVLSVTGDFGNWIFCREFYPTSDGYVSDHYWIEKLEIASTQKGTEYDSEATKELINERLSESELTEEEKEYYENLLCVIDDKWEYERTAYGDYPSNMDCESVPFREKTKIWLQIIFDGFEEICRRKKIAALENKEANLHLTTGQAQNTGA